MACSSTRFAKSNSAKAAIVAAALLSAGCSNPERLSLSPKPILTADRTVDQFEAGRDTSIRLRSIRVGSDTIDAQRQFSQPPNVRGYELRELPAQFGPAFVARGWETDHEGFGIVSYKGEVAAAIRIINRADEELVLETVRYTDSQLPYDAQTFASKAARYWFWEEGTHRKMICAVAIGKDKFLLTEAIGEVSVMDALQMSPKKAPGHLDRASRAVTGQ